MRYKYAGLCLFFSALLLSGLCAWPGQGRAADLKIAIVNIQKIMSEAKAAQSIQTQLEEQRKIFQEEFSQRERELAEKEKAIAESRASLSQEEFAKKRQEFEAELLEMRKLVQKRQHALEKAAADAIGELRDKVTEIVAGLAEKNKYDMVLTRQNVILAREEMDITAEVMKQLDKALKKIDLKVVKD